MFTFAMFFYQGFIMEAEGAPLEGATTRQVAVTLPTTRPSMRGIEGETPAGAAQGAGLTDGEPYNW